MTKHVFSRSVGAVFIPLALAACASTDVSQPVTVLAAAVDQLEKDNRKTLDTIANSEVRAMENHLMETGQFIAYANKSCDQATDLSQCAVTSNAYAELLKQPINAVQVSLTLRHFDEYFDALALLASPGSSDDVSKSAQALAASVAGLAKQADRAGASSIVKKHAGLFGQLVGKGVDQYRVATLKRIIRQAHPEIKTAGLGAAAWFDQRAGIPKLLDDVVAKSEALSTALTGSKAAQVEALRALESATAALRKAHAASPGRQLERLVAMHDTLSRSSKRSATPEDVLQTLTLTHQILTAIKEK